MLVCTLSTNSKMKWMMWLFRENFKWEAGDSEMLLSNTRPLLSRRLTELQSDCEIWQAMRPSWTPLLLLECGICARRLAEPSSRWQPHQIRLAGVGARVRTCTRDPQAISHPIWCQSDVSHDPILWKMTGGAAVLVCTPHQRHKQSAITPLSTCVALCKTSSQFAWWE